MTTSTITGTIVDGSGAAVSGVTVYARLRPGPASRLSDGSSIANPASTTTNGSGVYSFVLEQQANVVPAGSWWELEEDTPDASGGRRVRTISVGATAATVGQSEVTPLALLGPTALTQIQGDLRYQTRGAQLWVDVKTDYAAAGDGTTNDTPAFVSALNALAATGGVIYVPAGTYKIAATLQIPSNVTLVGAGRFVSILKASATLPDQTAAPFTGLSVSFIATNSDWVGGNTGIGLQHIGFDISLKGRGSDHCVHLRNSVGHRIIDCSTTGGGDGFANTLSSNFVIAFCYTTAHSNCHIDMWDACHDGLIFGNEIAGTGITNLNSILVTGIDTGTGSSPSKNVRIIGNRISNTKGGIWLQGGIINASTGSVQDCHVTGNIISGTTTNHAIRASEGLGHVIADNTILNPAQSGIILVGEASGGAPTDCDIHDNVIRGGGSNSTAAIDLGDGATSVNVHHNRSYGAGAQYGVACRSGATANNIESNICDAGTSGRILPGDATNVIRNNLAFANTGTGAATIASGATTVVVTHSLSVTPAIAKIQLTRENNPTNAVSSIWVTTITSTQFTINCNTDPGAGGLVVSWAVLQ